MDKAKKQFIQTESARTSHPESAAGYRILTVSEFSETDPSVYRHIFGTGRPQIRFCKVDRIGGSIAGTLSIPDHKAPVSKKHGFGYCLKGESLILIDDSSFVRSLLGRMKEKQLLEPQSPTLLFFGILDFILQDDMLLLQEYEARLASFEELLENGLPPDSEQNLMKLRRRLSIFGAYYEQLTDMGERLQDYASEDSLDKESMMFGSFARKASRLRSMVQMLKEYSLQLREMHQTQIDLKQNQIMKVLTIVTTVFMPLTLVAGWYGMNFKHMPELSAPHGYLIISLVCLIIIAVEILVFRIKKWF